MAGRLSDQLNVTGTVLTQQSHGAGHQCQPGGIVLHLPQLGFRQRVLDHASRTGFFPLPRQ